MTVTATAQDGDYNGLAAQVTVTVTDDDALTGCSLMLSLTAAQLADVVSVTVQGAWLTDLEHVDRLRMVSAWSNSGTLAIPAESLLEVTLAGAPPIVITDMALLAEVALGPVASSDEARDLLTRPGDTSWLQEAQDTGLIQIEGSFVDSVAVSADC